jgi:3-hydroxyisobutyrate dehydrogenase-like beta-hydroxyacid dehydrogenase
LVSNQDRETSVSLFYQFARRSLRLREASRIRGRSDRDAHPGQLLREPIVQRKLDRILSGRYDDANFALYLLAKDARYGASLARDLGAPRAVVEAAAETFSRAEKSGLGAKASPARQPGSRVRRRPPLSLGEILDFST